MPRLFTRRNIIIGILVTACIIIFLAYYTFLGFNRSMNQAQRENRSLRSLKALEGIMDNMQDIETGQRGYIISHDTLFLLPYKESLRKLHADTSHLLQLIKEFPERSVGYRKLLNYVADKVAHAIATVSQVSQGDFELALQSTRSGLGRQLMDSIRSIIFRLEQEDRSILYESGTSRQINARRSFRFLLIISLLMLTALVWLVWKLLNEEKIRRNNEKQIRYLAKLTEQSSDAIFSTDISGVILSWNKGAENIFGYSAEEAIGKFAPAITRSGRSSEEVKKISDEIQTGGSITTESVVYHKNGKEIYCLGSVTQLTNEQDQPAGAVVILRDITERKLNEKLLNQFNADLTDLVREKTELIRSIVERIRDGFYSLN
ncbi:MAG TPA: PAS domain S-box protein, partial [Chitinophagaceae bacterium]|nr:PAS domain S-box protein [Chitinophagaceae bacterium]